MLLVCRIDRYLSHLCSYFFKSLQIDKILIFENQIQKEVERGSNFVTTRMFKFRFRFRFYSVMNTESKVFLTLVLFEEPQSVKVNSRSVCKYWWKDDGVWYFSLLETSLESRNIFQRLWKQQKIFAQHFCDTRNYVRI